MWHAEVAMVVVNDVIDPSRSTFETTGKEYPDRVGNDEFRRIQGALSYIDL
jgi:hypothetical protein